MYEAKETRSFGANGGGSVSVLRLSLATFLAYPKKNYIYVLTDYDRWCDRKNTNLNPPFLFWQKLEIDTDEPIVAVSWCEELSYSESDCWLAAASSESVYLFAASKEQEDQVSILPVWRFVRKVAVFKRGYIRTLSWSSCFNVRKLLVGGKRLSLYVVNDADAAPVSVWKAKRYPVSGSVILDAKLSMDGRLFATAEKSSRVVRVWFSKHGVHGAYSCAHLPHERSVVSIAWRPYLTTSAKGDVQMIHGTSTRRALMTLTKGSVVYIWQESDKSEEFRMLLGLSFQAQMDLQNFSNPFKLLSSAWVTYRNKHEKFEWDQSNGNLFRDTNTGMNTAINLNEKSSSSTDDIGMQNQKKIMSKSHGHVVGRKETSVRIGPHAEHFEDTDYIIGLTSDNKIKVWVVSGIDARPRCSIAVKMWGSASTSVHTSNSTIIAATCFISDVRQVFSKASPNDLVVNSSIENDFTNGSMPEPIRLCLMVKNRQNASCRAVWLEWDANRPLSVAGQAAYDRGGQSIESRLYDAGHSHDITSISTLRNGGCIESTAISLDLDGSLKIWDLDSLSGVILSYSMDDPMQKIISADLWGGTIKTENGDNCWMTVLILLTEKLELAAYYYHNVTVSNLVEDNRGGTNSLWKLMCKTNIGDLMGVDCLKGSLNSSVDIRVVGMIDALYIGITHNIEKSVHFVHMAVFERKFTPLNFASHIFPSNILCSSFSRCSACFSNSTFFVACSDNRIYSRTMNEGENINFVEEIDVNQSKNREEFRILDFASTSKTSNIAVISKDCKKEIIYLEIYEKTDHTYNLDCVSMLETDLKIVGNKEVRFQVEWLSRYGHTSFVSVNCGTKIEVFCQKIGEGSKGKHHNLVKVAKTAAFDGICHGFAVRNNGDLLLNFKDNLKLYSGHLFSSSIDDENELLKDMDAVCADSSCTLPFHPKKLIQNIYADKIKRVRVVLTKLLDSLVAENEKNAAADNEVGEFGIGIKFADKSSQKEIPKRCFFGIPNMDTYIENKSTNDELSSGGADVDIDSFSSFSSSWVTDSNDTEMFMTAEKKTLSKLVDCIKDTQMLRQVLNKQEVLELSAFVGAFIDIYGDKRFTELNKGQKEVAVGAFAGLDKCATKYLIVWKLSQNLSTLSEGKNVASENAICDSLKSSIATRTLIWASLSRCSNMLLNKCIAPTATWSDVRSVGACFWIDNGKSVCTLAEKLARQQFLKSGQDPYACLLFYAALGKLKVIAGLFKMKREEKFYNFFMNDFSMDRWRSAALKNAYALMKQHKYELAAAFLLIGGKVFEAARICEKNLGDIQLALFIVRIVESSQTLTSTKYLKPWIENQLIEYSKQNKDVFIQCMSFKLIGKDDEVITCIDDSLSILSVDSKDVTSTACGEKWLNMSRGFDPTLALVYSHVQKEAFASKVEEKNGARSSTSFAAENYSGSSTSSIFDSFDFGASSRASSDEKKTAKSLSLFDSLDLGHDTDDPGNKKSTSDVKKFEKVVVNCAIQYANSGMPLMSLELLSENLTKLNSEYVLAAGIYEVFDGCLEKFICQYLNKYEEEIMIALVEENDSSEFRSLDEIVTDFINAVSYLSARFCNGFITQDIFLPHVEILFGKGKYIQALLLRSATYGSSCFNELPSLIEALSVNTIKVACNGLRLESPVNRKNGATILCLVRNYAQTILRLQKVSSTFSVSKSLAEDDKTEGQVLSKLTLSTLALKVAWLTRHILLLSDIISLDKNGGNFFGNVSSFSKLSRLLEKPSAFLYSLNQPLENICVLHVLQTRATLKLWTDYISTGSESQPTDPWIDSNVAHCYTTLERAIQKSTQDCADTNAGYLSNIDKACFTFGIYYNFLMENSHKMQIVMKKVSAFRKDIALSENVAMKILWTGLYPEEEVVSSSSAVDGKILSPKVLSDTDTSADEDDRDAGSYTAEDLVIDGHAHDGKVSKNAAASALFKSINNITGNDKSKHDMEKLPFFEIVHTTNIAINSFCFDRSDPASAFVTVATGNGIIETNIKSSLKFRKRSKNKKVLLDRDDLSWLKSRDRFWQEENDLLEQEMLDLASKESSHMPTLSQLLDRGRFTVSCQDHFVPNKSEIEERTLEAMAAMNAGRSFTVDDLQASCMESHTRFPFYMCGNALGELSLWSFGQTNCLAMYAKPGERSNAINNVRFNGLGDKFVACNASGIVQFWKFGSNPNCLTPYETINTKLNCAKDALFLNSGSVIAIGGSSGPSEKSVDGSFQLWDTLLPKSQQKLCSFGQKLDAGSCNTLMYLPMEELLVCGYESGKLVAFDIRQRCMLEVDSFSRRSCHRSSIISISHSHEHKLFGTASSDGCIKIWDSQTLNLKCTYPKVHDEVTKLSFRGDFLYSSGSDGRMVFLDVKKELS